MDFTEVLQIAFAVILAVLLAKGMRARESAPVVPDVRPDMVLETGLRQLPVLLRGPYLFTQAEGA